MTYRNIVLTGFMGTGKTTAAKLISKKLGWEMIDIDQLIEAHEGKTIIRIFETIGETGFRELEARYVEEVSQFTGKVVATGGGVVLREENMVNLRKNGIIVCLKASPGTILRNIRGNTDRPLLADENPGKRIHELLEYREKYYSNCDIEIFIDNLSAEQVSDEVIEAFYEFNNNKLEIE